MKNAPVTRNIGLDAARCVAIALVLLAHGSKYLPSTWTAFNPALFWGLGVMGVELFFGLSGFLIGNILLDIHASTNRIPSACRFMLRRFMRTLPLYFVVMGILLTFPVLDPNPHQSMWNYLVLGQNFFSPMTGIWFGTSWSLVIEEWSYFFLPLMAFLICGSSRHAVAYAALALCCAGLFERALLSDSLYAWDETIRKVFVMRLDAIAYGVLAACLYRRYQASTYRWARRLAPLNLGLLSLIFTLCAVRSTHPEYIQSFSGRVLMLSLTGIAFAGLVILALRCRVPSCLVPAIRFVAKISYALYLVHWPMLFVLDGLPIAVRFPSFLVIVVAVSTLMSYGIEQPIMRLRPKQFG